MERYSQTHEESDTDPSPEWTTPGDETGVEGESYPERPNEADCIYYLRTGFCGYGARCRFNHPPARNTVMGGARPGSEEYPERAGQPVCQYFMRTGTCKFGASCKYHHPRQGGGSVSPIMLNYYGYPLRPGEKECAYYVKTGQCKFGATCKFHHSQPAPSPAPVSASVIAPALYPAMQSPSQQYGVVVARPPLVPGSYVQGPYGHLVLPPGIFPYPGWSSYSASVNPLASPSTQPTVGPGSLYGMTQLSPSAPAYIGPYQSLSSSVVTSSSSQKENKFPERPGQPECQYYLKTGDCKFGNSCRYHHPPECSAPKMNVILSPIGLPLRPGATPCTHYAQRGVCKFGPACKFDHPMGTLSYCPSASSLADMPVAPYPVGSVICTLAPSSSSLESRPELISGGSKDSISIRMSSSSGTSCGSVGSIFSKSGSVPLTSIQQSDQSSGPLTGGSGSAEAHTSS